MSANVGSVVRTKLIESQSFKGKIAGLQWPWPTLGGRWLYDLLGEVAVQVGEAFADVDM